MPYGSHNYKDCSNSIVVKHEVDIIITTAFMAILRFKILLAFEVIHKLLLAAILLLDCDYH